MHGTSAFPAVHPAPRCRLHHVWTAQPVSRLASAMVVLDTPPTECDEVAPRPDPACKDAVGRRGVWLMKEVCVATPHRLTAHMGRTICGATREPKGWVASRAQHTILALRCPLNGCLRGTGWPEGRDPARVRYECSGRECMAQAPSRPCIRLHGADCTTFGQHSP